MTLRYVTLAAKNAVVILWRFTIGEATKKHAAASLRVLQDWSTRMLQEGYGRSAVLAAINTGTREAWTEAGAAIPNDLVDLAGLRQVLP